MTAAPLQIVLLHVLVFASGLGVLHVLMTLRRRPLHVATFCAVGGLVHLAAGGLALGRALSAQLLRWPFTGALWAVLTILGLYVVGCVLSLAWIGTVKGTALWAERHRRRS